MKKITKILLLLFVFTLFTGCTKETEVDEEKYLQEISYSELLEKIENKETFFFEVMQDDCSYCQAFTPKLISVLKEYEIKGYKLNITKLTEDEYKEFDKNFGIDGTPETIFITEGKEKTKLQRIEGNTSKTKIVAKLKSNGYITKEDAE